MYTEDAVEASAVVFPGNGGGEFDKLGFGEMSSQAGGELAWYFRGCFGHGHGEIERDTIEATESRAGLVVA